jgi:hypothetical protein
MDDKTGSGTKVAIWTALITAAATILTAYIAVLPQIRQGDQQKIDELSKTTASLQSELDSMNSSPKAVAYKLSGSIKNKANNAPVTDAFLYASPSADLALPDDQGNFQLAPIGGQAYNVVVATPGGQMQRLLVTPDGPPSETVIGDLTITYSLAKE